MSSHPPRTKPLSHQVAGHLAPQHEKSKKQAGPCFLETEDGCILKPIQAPPRGTKELNFYEQINDSSCTDPVVLKLRPLLAKYYGMKTFDSEPGVQYIQLEDIASKFKKPNIIDIKMGAVTYDPEATPEKIAREKKKYPPLEKIGFQIRGFRVYDNKSGRYDVYDKQFTRTLDEETIVTKGLVTFFTRECLQQDVIQEVLMRVRHVKAWFDSQSQFAFYASSILVVYEGAVPELSANQSLSSDSSTCSGANGDLNELAAMTGMSSAVNGSSSTLDGSSTSVNGSTSTSLSASICNGTHSCHGDKTVSCDAFSDGSGSCSAALADVRLIDFAHWFKVDKPDENYMIGLRNLICYLEQLLTM